MPASRLPIWRLVTLSYVDVWRALRAMPVLFGCAALISLAVTVVMQLLPHRLESGPAFGTLSSIVENVMTYFCLTPVMIAIHRFIIRGDATRNYTVDFKDKAFLPFFAWAMALSLIFSLVFALNELLNAGSGHPTIATVAVVAVLACLAAVWLPLRLMVLFPAIAVGASGATAANAFADTKGYGLRLFAIVILASIPVIVVGVLAALALGRGAMTRGSVPFVIGDVLGALMGTFIMAISVVIASHIYLAIGRTVR
jgi:hypothetical protein